MSWKDVVRLTEYSFKLPSYLDKRLTVIIAQIFHIRIATGLLILSTVFLTVATCQAGTNSGSAEILMTQGVFHVVGLNFTLAWDVPPTWVAKSVSWYMNDS